MGQRRSAQLRSSPLVHPNPGKRTPELPAAPMWIDKDGMSFPEMQHISGSLKKNNIVFIPLLSEESNMYLLL
jgi:hypothetical protein